MTTARQVLIIDDDDALRTTLSALVEEEGFQSLAARTGQEGLIILDQVPVDVVVTDILMPKKGGNELIRDIRQRHPKMAIIAISGGGRTQNMDFLEFAVKQGADRALAKPFDMSEFIDVIKELLRAKAKDSD